MLSLGNIACKDKYLDEGHLLLCILLVFSITDASHKRRVEVFHECLEVVLQPFKEMSFRFPPNNLLLLFCYFP